MLLSLTPHKRSPGRYPDPRLALRPTTHTATPGMCNNIQYTQKIIQIPNNRSTSIRVKISRERIDYTFDLTQLSLSARNRLYNPNSSLGKGPRNHDAQTYGEDSGHRVPHKRSHRLLGSIQSHREKYIQVCGTSLSL